MLPPAFLAVGEARMSERGVLLETLVGELLREMQRSAGMPIFALIHEPLAPSDAALICREHQSSEVAG